MYINNTLRKISKALLYSTLFSGSILGYYNIVTKEFFEIGMCQGDSMKPTLQNNHLVLTKKLNVYDVKRGDIVIYRSPITPEKQVCKRVIHLPHDSVVSDKFSLKVPKGYIWVEGDNSVSSIDSRHYGPIPKGLLLGKVVFVSNFFGDINGFHF